MNLPIKNIPALTGYRAIAAWSVFVYHFFPLKNTNYPEWSRNFVSSFHIGVDLFFVLSGFLITYRYYNNSPIDFKKYIVNRIARIYPMYFILTLAVFFVFYFNNHSWSTEKTKELILNLTLTKALFKDYFLSGIPQGWTLTLEEIFYFSAPVFYAVIKKSHYNLIILPVLIFFIGLVLKNLRLPIDFGGFLKHNIAIHIFEFFGGIILAYGILKRKVKFNLKGVTYFSLFFLFIYCATRYSYFSKRFDLNSDIDRAIEIIILTTFGIVPLIYGLIFEKTFLQKMLSTRLFVVMGQSSYIFYLIHKGFISIFIDKHITSNLFLLFAILNLVSYLLFKYIEEPLNIKIRKTYS